MSFKPHPSENLTSRAFRFLKFCARLPCMQTRRLQNILENQASQKTAKFIKMKSIVILRKVNEMYNTLQTLLGTGNYSKDEGRIGLSKFFAGAFTTPLFY